MVVLTLANTVQNAIIGDDNTVTGGAIGATTLLALNYALVRFLYEHRKIDRLVEGDAEMIVEKGKVKKERLKKELITLAELEAAAHRQGFASLAEVERAVLEPGGTLSFLGKEPPPDEARHRELVRRLDHLAQEMA